MMTVVARKIRQVKPLKLVFHWQIGSSVVCPWKSIITPCNCLRVIQMENLWGTYEKC